MSYKKKDLGGTYSFFEKYLEKYYDENNKEKSILINDEDVFVFREFDILYSDSKGSSVTEWNEEMFNADALMFYRSTGLIVNDKSTYNMYIDNMKLKAAYANYITYKKSLDNVKVIKKGSIK